MLLRFISLFLALRCSCVLGEVFTALVDMEGLVRTELELIQHLDNYIQAEEVRLKKLKRLVLLLEDILYECI